MTACSAVLKPRLLGWHLKIHPSRMLCGPEHIRATLYCRGKMPPTMKNIVPTFSLICSRRAKFTIGIASDYAENRWIRERTRHMTAVATRRHPFGEALEKSGARSWQDVLEIVRKRGNEDRKLLQSIAERMRQFTQTVQDMI